MKSKLFKNKFILKIISSNMKRIINVDSLFAQSHTSSCDFIYEFPIKINGIKEIELISGNIPATTEPYLFLDIPELKTREVYGMYNKRYVAMLRYELPATGEQNLLDLPTPGHSARICGDLGTLQKITIKLYARWGVLHSFGTSKINVASFSNASPTLITTSINHGLVNGDVIFVRDFTNASTRTIQGLITNNQYVVTVISPTTFTIPLDLSGEAVSQQITGTQPAFTLGQGSEIKFGDIGYLTTNYASGPTGTIITTHGNHVMSVGSYIRIINFTNGSTFLDNEKINTQHIIIATPALNQIEISNKLSAYPATNQVTGTQPAYTLGLNSKIFPTKYQTSFDFKILSSDSIFSKKK
jgi:hypothetical protein